MKSRRMRPFKQTLHKNIRANKMQTKKYGRLRRKHRSSRRNMKGGENEDVLKRLIDNGYFARMIMAEDILDILFKETNEGEDNKYQKFIDRLPRNRVVPKSEKVTRGDIDTDELQQTIPVWLKMLVDNEYLKLTIERNVPVTNLRPVATDPKKSYYQGVSENKSYNLNKDQNDSTDKYTFSIDNNRYTFSVLDPGTNIVEDLKGFKVFDTNTGFDKTDAIMKSIKWNLSLAIVEQVEISINGVLKDRKITQRKRYAKMGAIVLILAAITGMVMNQPQAPFKSGVAGDMTDYSYTGVAPRTNPPYGVGQIPTLDKLTNDYFDMNKQVMSVDDKLNNKYGMYQVTKDGMTTLYFNDGINDQTIYFERANKIANQKGNEYLKNSVVTKIDKKNNVNPYGIQLPTNLAELLIEGTLVTREEAEKAKKLKDGFLSNIPSYKE
jgi:hypothetical protein